MEGGGTTNGDSCEKARWTSGITTYINKSIRESFKNALEHVKSAGEEPTVQHTAIQEIMSEHKLTDVQTNNQIKNWIYGEVNLALDKIETAGEVPSKEHPDIQQLKARYNFLTQDRLTRSIEKWQQKNQKQSTVENSSAASMSKTADGGATSGDRGDRTPEQYACILKKDDKFFVKDIGGPFPEPEIPDFGENVVWAINYLHGKGYSCMDGKDQIRWKKTLNRKRDETGGYASKEPLTLCVFRKDGDVVPSSEPVVVHRPKIAVLYLEPTESETCRTERVGWGKKSGKAYLQGSDDESFQGHYEVLGEAVKEALRLGYTRMDETKELRWSKLINDFIRVEDALDLWGWVPEKIYNGWYDKIVAIYEK